MNDIKSLIDNWGHSVWLYLPKIFLALLVVVGFYLVARLLKKYSLNLYAKTFKKSYQFAVFVATLIYIFILLSGVFIALEVLGLESVLAKLVAGAGIVGIVAGFAFKDIASNAFAGFLLNMQRPFKKGDWVAIDSAYGIIEKTGLITTSIVNVEGQEVFVPNQIIYNTSFINYSTFQKRLVVLNAGVSYGDDLDHVRTVTIDEITRINNRMKNEPIDFYFVEIGSSTFNFEVRFWIEFLHQKDYLEAKSDLIIRLKKRFEAEGISLAYSVLSLDFGVKGGVNLFDKKIEIQ